VRKYKCTHENADGMLGGCTESAHLAHHYGVI